jgi:hypothetical protein
MRNTPTLFIPPPHVGGEQLATENAHDIQASTNTCEKQYSGTVLHRTARYTKISIDQDI